jgi:hypothetical protein
VTEQTLLERVMAANPVPDPTSLPEGTIDIDTLRQYVADSPRPAIEAAGVVWRRGVWMAAAVFIAVLALGVGYWIARSNGETGVVEEPRITTTVPPATTTPPTTEAIEQGAPVDPEAMSVIENLVEALDDGDAEAAAALVAGGAAAAQIDDIATADLFDDGYRLVDCLDFSGVVRCEVDVTDFFIDQLDLEPWPQSWEIEVEEVAVTRLDVSGDHPQLVQAVGDFESFVAEREPEAAPLTDNTGRWVRSLETIETSARHLVEFSALRSGIPPETWTTIASYFTTLSAGDLEAFETLLAADASFEERSGPTGGQTVSYDRTQEQFLGHFWFEYIGLHTDTEPLQCTGDATAVSCRARNTGVMQLDTGGFEDGLLLFDLEDGLLTSIRDRFNKNARTDLGTFFDRWIFDNGPDLTGQWSGEGSDIPETPEVARLLLEWYPRYLADTGTDVPPEYLDGSLLED